MSIFNNPRIMYRLRMGGTWDTIPLIGIAGAGIACSPFFTQAQIIPIEALSLASYTMAAAGSATLTRRIRKTLGFKLFDSKVSINSDDPSDALQKPSKGSDYKPQPKNGWNGMLMGYCVDTGKPLIIEWELWMRHCFIIGQSGVGKTVMGNWLMFQQITQGGGLLWIDGKLDIDNLNALNTMCAWAGRRGDLYVINPGDPSCSNTYNPILFGDADEVSARCLSLVPSSEGNPGTDYYRSAADQGIKTLVAAIQKTGLAYNFMDLSIMLQNEKALAYLESLVPKGTSEAKQLSLFLEQFKVVDQKTHVSRIDLKKLKDTFGGMGGKLHSFGSGNFGEITSSYTPDVNLFDAIKGNKIVYVALPTMGKAEASSAFGKMIVGDFRTAISWVQALKKEDRPWPPYLGFFDEAGSYISDSWNRIFEQSRSAHIAMCPAVQTIANLDAVSEELREMVIGNMWTKAFFKIGTDATAELSSELIGTEMASAISLASTGGAGVQAAAGTGSKTGVAQSISTGYTEREEEVQRVSAQAFKELSIGETIVNFGGDMVFQLKVPRLTFTKTFLDAVGPFELNKTFQLSAQGLNLIKKTDFLLSTGNDDY